MKNKDTYQTELEKGRLDQRAGDQEVFLLESKGSACRLQGPLLLELVVDLVAVNRTPHLLGGHFPTDPKQPRTPGGSVLRGGSCHTLSSLVLFICTRHSPGRCAA